MVNPSDLSENHTFVDSLFLHTSPLSVHVFHLGSRVMKNHKTSAVRNNRVTDVALVQQLLLEQSTASAFRLQKFNVLVFTCPTVTFQISEKKKGVTSTTKEEFQLFLITCLTRSALKMSVFLFSNVPWDELFGAQRLFGLQIHPQELGVFDHLILGGLLVLADFWQKKW